MATIYLSRVSEHYTLYLVNDAGTQTTATLESTPEGGLFASRHKRGTAWDALKAAYDAGDPMYFWRTRPSSKLYCYNPDDEDASANPPKLPLEAWMHDVNPFEPLAEAKDIIPQGDKAGVVALEANATSVPTAPTAARMETTGWVQRSLGSFYPIDEAPAPAQGENTYVILAHVGSPPYTVEQSQWLTGPNKSSIRHAPTAHGLWSTTAAADKPWRDVITTGGRSAPFLAKPTPTNGWRVVEGHNFVAATSQDSNFLHAAVSPRVKFEDFDELLVGWYSHHVTYGDMDRLVGPFPREIVERHIGSWDTDEDATPASRSILLFGGLYGSDILWGYDSGSLPAPSYPDQALYFELQRPSDGSDAIGAVVTDGARVNVVAQQIRLYVR